ncbi:MAG: urease accessory protein UreE [Xanthobacteraceae bacterium]|nr:urease accessory protein UreE [Xanthobacteraceae bacterium]
MPRAIRLLAADEPRPAICDTLLLTAEQRRLQRGFVFGGKGTCVEFDFPEALTLRTDDALLLDDGNAVEVVADVEPLLEVRAEFPVLARLAWMLGDRHVPVEIMPNRLRLRRDPALETLLASAGGKVRAIDAPFSPEGGAYVIGGAAHDLHEHHHDHGHDHHDHAHGDGGTPDAHSTGKEPG